MLHLTLCSSYQAGEGIYELFDKVMVLDHGRQVYYGPPSEARAYFEQLGYKSLPRQSTPDYLTGCTDQNERQFAPGRSERDTPSTPEALEAAYASSNTARDVRDHLEKYKLKMDTDKTDHEAFRAAVADDKKKGVSQKSPYTLGFTGQVRALTKRQFQMRLQDRFQLVTSFGLSIVRTPMTLRCMICSLRRAGPCARDRRCILRSTTYFSRSIYSGRCHLRGITDSQSNSVLSCSLVLMHLCVF